MLIIEGSDCLGKTTLAKKIVVKMMEKGYPTVYSHMTRPNESIFDFFLNYKKILNPCAVQDRFHLGGLAYHHDKITPQKLQIINAWIRAKGGLIVVLYAGDEVAYRKRLENDKRGNMLTIDKMCAGNNFFKRYALNQDKDWRFNIMPSMMNSLEVPMYVSDFDIDEIVDEWIQRRQLLGI